MREKIHFLMGKGLFPVEILLYLDHEGLDIGADRQIIDQLPPLVRESLLISALKKLS